MKLLYLYYTLNWVWYILRSFTKTIFKESKLQSLLVHTPSRTILLTTSINWTFDHAHSLHHILHGTHFIQSWLHPHSLQSTCYCTLALNSLLHPFLVVASIPYPGAALYLKCAHGCIHWERGQEPTVKCTIWATALTKLYQSEASTWNSSKASYNKNRSRTWSHNLLTQVNCKQAIKHVWKKIKYFK